MAPPARHSRLPDCEAPNARRNALYIVTPERWEQVAEIFAEAVELGPADRARFLAGVCADAEIRLEVGRLLAQHDSAGAFLEEPIVLPEDVGEHLRELAPGQELQGRFRISRFLARGGMGEVYDAYDKVLGAHVALKTIAPELASNPAVLRQFRHEVQFARTVTHRNICRVHDLFGADGPGPLFLTMELVDGVTLAEKLRGGPLPEPPALEILRQVALGLDAAHASGVVHRDLKCANILLAEDRNGAVRAVITDFGIASAERPVEGAFVAGSPDYMAPEQRAGAPPAPACDIYSLGVIAHEAVAGTRPAAGGAASPKLPRRWQRAIAKCLAADPDQRYRSASEFVDALAGGDREMKRRTLVLAVSGAVATGAAALERWGRSGSGLGTLSIAVVPFEAASEDLRPLATGIAGELIRTLARSPLLHVTGEASAHAAIGGGVSWIAAARRLGVEHVLSGAVRHEGSDVVVRWWLRSGSDRGVESEQTISVPAAEIARLPAAIALAAAAAMRVQLAPPRPAVFASPQAGSEAFSEYVLARAAALRRSVPSLRESVERFTAALRLAPNFASAYAGLGLSWNMLAGQSGHPLAATFRSSEEAAHRALELDVSLGEAHLNLASIAQRRDWDWQTSDRRYGTALAFAPGLAMAHQWRSGLLSILRRPADAVAEAEKACALDPLAIPPKAALAGMLYRARRYDEAIRQYRLMLQLNPEYGAAWDGIAAVYQMLRNFDAAIEAEQEAARLSQRGPAHLGVLAELYALAGRRRDALDTVAELERRWPSEQFFPWALAQAYRGLGDLDTAFRWVAVAVELRDPNVTTLAAEPANDPFRGDARFTRYVTDLKL